MNITLTKGDSINANFQFFKNGSPANISGYALTFSVKKQIHDNANLIQKTIGAGITVTDAPNGKFTVSITSSDTASIDIPYRAVDLFFSIIAALDINNTHSGTGSLTLQQI